MYRNVQRGFNTGNDFFMEPSTPPVSSRPPNQRKNGDDSPNEFSPGLLDLHSFDTELLPEVGHLSFLLSSKNCSHLLNVDFTCSIYG